MSAVNIAKRLAENLGVAITLEDGIGGVLNEADQKPGPAKGRLNLHGRFDIVLWGSHSLVGVIEIKKAHGMSTLKRDLQRICSVLDIAKQIRWGLMVYSTRIWQGHHKSAEDRVLARTDQIFSNARNFIANGCGIKSYKKLIQRKSGPVAVTVVDESDQDFEEFAWRSEVLKISRSKQ